MRARFLGQSLDAVEIYDQQPGKTRQGEWIERLIFSNAGKLAQAERAQFELFSLFRSRQKKISHEGFIVAQVGTLRRDGVRTGSDSDRASTSPSPPVCEYDTRSLSLPVLTAYHISRASACSG